MATIYFISINDAVTQISFLLTEIMMADCIIETHEQS